MGGDLLRPGLVALSAIGGARYSARCTLHALRGAWSVRVFGAWLLFIFGAMIVARSSVVRRGSLRFSLVSRCVEIVLLTRNGLAGLRPVPWRCHLFA